jgi:putative endonuclease
MNYWVYVLENEAGRWYIGQTNNLEARIERHNSQKVRSTKNRGFWNIIHKEKFGTRSEALKREEYLKSGAGRKLLKKLLNK